MSMSFFASFAPLREELLGRFANAFLYAPANGGFGLLESFGE
jgi:hypothetical protein